MIEFNTGIEQGRDSHMTWMHCKLDCLFMASLHYLCCYFLLRHPSISEDSHCSPSRAVDLYSHTHPHTHTLEHAQASAQKHEPVPCCCDQSDLITNHHNHLFYFPSIIGLDVSNDWIRMWTQDVAPNRPPFSWGHRSTDQPVTVSHIHSSYHGTAAL